jgi:hypothetical protein
VSEPKIADLVIMLRGLCPCGADHSAEELFPCACGTCTPARWPICGDSRQMLYDWAKCSVCGAQDKQWTRHGREFCEEIPMEPCCG